jgi:DNA repair exonuclease SbcCD ATPase subunit
MEEDKKALDDYKESSAKELSDAERAATEADIAYKTECAKTEPLSAQLKAREEEQKKAEKALEEGKALVAEKVLALKDEIADKDPDKFEKELDQAVKTATDEVQKIAEAIRTLRENIKEIEGKIQVATENRKLAEKKSKAKAEELNEWLSEYNLQEGVTALSVEDIKAFHQSTDNWEEIRDEQKRLDTEITRTRTTLDNEKTAHKEHQQTKPEKTEEELSARKAELTSKSNTELVESKARMQRHEAAKAAMGGLSEAVENAKQAKKDWEEINDAIGGDGKTLRKIAQCYTLRFLIEHANVEIRKFNSRYELMQVKNSLGIRIIDHDRADDIRDTTSLSGGETFIVSLGLALGLSALSSRNISFENLFIDEGFGTLDPETLATVIDSLAMLQSSQGKKVGVISHTDTMSERITTQIRIIKNGNSGSSRIEIWPQ